MSVTMTVTKEMVVANNPPIRAADAVASGSGPIISELIPVNQTNLPMAFAFANSKLKSFYAYSDAAITIYTNEASSGTPQEKITLPVGKAFYWSLTDSFLGAVGDSAESPFAGDVTGLFVTNTAAANLTVVAIVDPT